MSHGRRQATRTTPRLLAVLFALFVLGLAESSGTRAAVGTTFTVDTTDGTTDGICGGASDCSFGDAIEAANANSGKDTIAFGIPGAGPHLIVLSDPFPAPSPFVADAVVIDGGTQPGYAGTPLVEIDTSNWGFGLMIQGAGSAGTEIRGLAIHGGTETPLTATIRFDNPGSNVVEHNFIGTDASGTVVKGGALVYVGRTDGLVSSASTIADNVIAGTPCCVSLDRVSDSQVLRNLIGTDASGLVGLSNGSGVGIQVFGDRNLLSGNVIARTFIGIRLSGPSSDTRIEGNRIGTDKTGTVGLGNSSVGVAINFAGTNTSIGGADPAAGNVISGNGGCGICIEASGETVVQGNLIGTDIGGAIDLGNRGSGITVCCTGAPGNEAFPLIADNVVSGNDAQGIDVTTIGSARIERNLIGTNGQGTAAIGNEGAGIKIGAESVGSVIGGASAAQRNVISGNGGNGVEVFPDVSGLRVLNNYIGTNKDGDGDLGNGGAGVFVSGHNTKIGQPGAGNLISGNAGPGVRLSGDGAVIQANLIGTGASGKAALGNEGAGVLGGGDFDATIGGAAAGERNVISGNGGWGVQLLAGGGASVIERNRIGTNEGGAIPLPNALGGIDMARGAPFDIVANLISGNGGDGVRAVAGLFTSNRVIGNLIGTDASGGSDLGNAGNGVHLLGEFGFGVIVVGGTTPGDRNVISGNGQNGVLHESSVRHEIVGNYIGTDLQGANGIPNDKSGVRLNGSTTVRGNVVSGNGLDGIELHSSLSEVRGNLVGTGANGASSLGNSRHGVSIDGGGAATENTVGGPVGDGNTIAFNGGDGIIIRRAHLNLVKRNEIFSNGADGVAVVEVPPFGAIRNTISENAISSNGGLGIDLGDDGVTPNDPGDGDSGANFLQNFPVDLQLSADRTTVTGTLNSLPNRTYRIELYGNSAGAACDPSGNGEGEMFLASTDAATDGSGDAPFSMSLPSPLPNGDFVTATATDVTGGSPGDTSEFSQCIQPPQRATIVVRKGTVPSPDPTDTSFAFTAGGGLGPASFSLKDGQSQTFPDLVPQAGYSVAETTPAGWDSTSACSDGSPVSNIDLAPGETVTCTFTNRRRGTIVVRKATVPSPDPTDTSFAFTAGGGLGPASFSLKDGQSQTFPDLVPQAGYSVAETTPAGWDSTSACSDGSPVSNIDLAPGETVTCTFTNTKRGMAQVLKTVIDAPPSGSHSFCFELRSGASTTTSGTTLEARCATAGNGGVVSFTTQLVPATPYALCEIVMPGWMTTLGPQFYVVYNASGDNSTVCTDFTVGPGETKSFAVDNKPPPGGLARTIGFWKNWASCSGSKGKQKPVLDQTLAAADPAGIVIGVLILHGGDCLKAVRLLDKSTVDAGKKMASDPAFALAAQLLAAKLNIVARAGSCPTAVSAINDGQTLLASIHFNGITHDKLSGAQVTQANGLASTLDRYNNNLLC